MREVCLIAWSIISAAAACIALPGSLELLVLTVASLLPERRALAKSTEGPWRVVVVIPAHNEETGIASCVRSLLHADHVDIDVEIYVIADNCTDNTAMVAKCAGATVLERTDPINRGKGYALHFAFTYLETTSFDCVLVVDADTEVAPNFITTAANAMRNGAEAVQARYLVRNLGDNTRTRLMGLALCAFNVVRPLGREHLGLSAGIFGNGFGLRRNTLQAVPYLASSVVEDLEYHLSLVRSGRRVVFLNETTVYGEMPVRGKGVKTQRSRWEGGRLRMLAEKSPVLFGEVLRGRLRLLEPLLDLLLLPLAFHVSLLITATASPISFVRDIGFAGAAIVLFHLVTATVLGDGSWRSAAALAVAPFYVVWKLMLIPSLIRNARSSQAWVRTSRNAEGILSDGENTSQQ